MDILIAVPTFENISPETFKSIYDLEKIPGGNFRFEFVKGYDCARARNKIAKLSLDINCDYVLMVDSDIVLPSDTIKNLIEFGPDISVGYYSQKNDSGMSEVFNFNHEDYTSENRYSIADILSLNGERIPVMGCGLGCALIKTDIFKSLRYPYFHYVNYANGNLLSEDLYFCTQARNKSYAIILDSRVRCMHIGRKVYQ